MSLNVSCVRYGLQSSRFLKLLLEFFVFMLLLLHFCLQAATAVPKRFSKANSKETLQHCGSHLCALTTCNRLWYQDLQITSRIPSRKLKAWICRCWFYKWDEIQLELKTLNLTIGGYWRMSGLNRRSCLQLLLQFFCLLSLLCNLFLPPAHTGEWLINFTSTLAMPTHHCMISKQNSEMNRNDMVTYNIYIYILVVRVCSFWHMSLSALDKENLQWVYSLGLSAVNAYDTSPARTSHVSCRVADSWSFFSSSSFFCFCCSISASQLQLLSPSKLSRNCRKFLQSNKRRFVGIHLKCPRHIANRFVDKI